MSATNLAGELPEKSVQRAISQAESLYARCGPAAGQVPQIRALLTRYGAAIAETRALMQRLGITAWCAACALEGFGSCCFSGVENQYDPLLLLVNLLLGCQLPAAQEIPGKCFFVGPYGCKLLARHYYCLRYLCPELLAYLGPSGSQAICAAVGAELSVGWELEQTLRQWQRGPAR